jgi:hypothetical protein
MSGSRPISFTTRDEGESEGESEGERTERERRENGERKEREKEGGIKETRKEV